MSKAKGIPDPTPPPNYPTGVYCCRQLLLWNVVDACRSQRISYFV